VAKNEQRLARQVVDAWYVEPTIPSAVGRLDKAGVEHAAMPPATMWEAASVRAFRNAGEVQARLDTVLASGSDSHDLVVRVARGGGTSEAQAEALVTRFRTVDVDRSIAAIDAKVAETA